VRDGNYLKPFSLPPESVGEEIMLLDGPRSLVRSSGQILLPGYLMNGLSNLDETYREYSLALLMT